MLPRGGGLWGWLLSRWRCCAFRESGNWCFRWRRRSGDVVHERDSEPNELGGKRDSADPGRSVFCDRGLAICAFGTLCARDVPGTPLPHGLRTVAGNGDVLLPRALELSER